MEIEIVSITYIYFMSQLLVNFHRLQSLYFAILLTKSEIPFEQLGYIYADYVLVNSL